MLRVNTVRCDFYGRLAAVDMKPIRIERLKLFAKRHGVADDHSGLGLLIGKKPNQVYNLLEGRASFGEKVARSIEEAAGLPVRWLDGEEAMRAAANRMSAEVLEIAMEIDTLPRGPDRDRVLRWCRDAIEMAKPKKPPGPDTRSGEQGG